MTNSKFVRIRYRKSPCKLYGIQIYARMNVGATYRDVHSDEKPVSAFDRGWRWKLGYAALRKTKIFALPFTLFAWWLSGGSWKKFVTCVTRTCDSINSKNDGTCSRVSDCAASGWDNTPSIIVGLRTYGHLAFGRTAALNMKSMNFEMLEGNGLSSNFGLRFQIVCRVKKATDRVIQAVRFVQMCTPSWYTP